MIKEIEAKKILATVKQPDDWFGLKYNMNLYRGCQHKCIYCDSRSDCYQIENFDDIEVKVNALTLLRSELASKRNKGTIGFGSMNDPYMPIEKEYRYTREALKIIKEFKFPVHIITKSDKVLEDLYLLKAINARSYTAISITITTADDDLARKIEPGASSPTKRFEAIRKLTNAGILAGVTLMPLLPFILDNEENVREILKKAKSSRVQYIIPAFGMTLRDSQREYYYNKLDKHFPGLKEKYQHQFGNKYNAYGENIKQLYDLFYQLMRKYNIPTKMPFYNPTQDIQLNMF